MSASIVASSTGPERDAVRGRRFLHVLRCGFIRISLAIVAVEAPNAAFAQTVPQELPQVPVAPASETLPTWRPATLRRIESDAEAYQRLQRLPRRAGSIVLVALGTTVVAAGGITALIAASSFTDPETGVYWPPNRRAERIGIGVTVVGAGVLIFGSYRLVKRNRGLRSLMAEGYLIVRNERHLVLAMDADVGTGGAASHFSLRF